ncbi:MAG: hypothetical protein JNK74_17585 [Candidatus Hydrogenedentes bacterium]|nr:hypothetical protein [Candidatus Hydrogenedentota bacterium]
MALVWIASGFGGCAGTALRLAGTKDAKIVDGPFRGRWWNYYERGRAYQQRGEFPEAEQDFQTAIMARSRDVLWPRTYGMHFIPEYFPHRELGVSLYYQGDLERAVEHLQASLDHQFSARAAHYFKQAQQQRIAALGDKEPPSLEVRMGESILSDSRVEFSAVARDDTFVSGIEVNGVPVDIRVIGSEVAFSYPVTLSPGSNHVHVRVVDLGGNEFVDDVTLETDLDGPAISFDTPITIPGVVTGQIYDASGVASLAVGTTEARLVEQGSGVYSFEVSVLSQSAPLKFESHDTLGNRTYGEAPLPAEHVADPAPVALASNDAKHAVELLSGERIAASVVAVEPVRIRLDNIPEGAAYYQDEIIVALNARSKEPIKSIVLLGEEIGLVPARNDVYITRRVRLDPGPNTLEAVVTDTQGNQASDERSVQRDASELENMKNKLAIAMMPKSLPADTLTQHVVGEMHGRRGSTAGGSGSEQTLADRFAIVNREQLDTVLREQVLSAELGATDRALILNQLIPFEVLLLFQANLDNGTLEIIADGVSSEKGVFVTGRVDVAGDEKDVDELLDQLAVRILQEFPRAQGEVISWDSPELTSTLTKEQGVRENRKCLVYRLEDVVHKGEVIGSKPEILAEGFITSTGSKFSTADLFSVSGDGEPMALELGEGDYVVLK